MKYNITHYLFEDGKHVFHGNQFHPDKIGLPGPDFEDNVPVSDSDIETAAAYLEEHEPDELVVYSRGSAVLHKLVADKPDVNIPNKITYIAPAAEREQWGTKGLNPPSGVSGEVIASVDDGAVSLKQAATIAQKGGFDFKVGKGKNYPEKSEEIEGKINHVKPLGYLQGKFKTKTLNPSEYLGQTDAPDWGTGIADRPTLKKQADVANDVVGEEIFENQRRSKMRLTENQLRRIIRSVINESGFGSLSDEEMAQLSPILYDIETAYNNFMNIRETADMLLDQGYSKEEYEEALDEAYGDGRAIAIINLCLQQMY